VRRAAVALVVLALLAAVAVASLLPRGEPGRWFPLTDAQRAEIAELEAIGYVGGTLPPGEHAAGVFVHLPDAHVGPRLYVSGDGPVARLIDESGAVLHTWRGDFWAAFPAADVTWGHGATETWRRARLLPDGSLLAIHEGIGMVHLDRESRLLWANPGNYHHDLQVAGAEIVALAREARMIPDLDTEHPILEDRVAWLRVSDGAEVRAVSVIDAFRRSRFADRLPSRRTREDGDLLHTNGLWVLDGRMAAENPAFAAGNILLSLREISTLAVLDPVAGVIAWAMRGPWQAQHDPQPDGEGGLVLFDNHGGPARVLWLDARGQVTRSWGGEGEPLQSAILGAVAPLPDGAVWVSESERGTVWEVDRAGRVRWAFANPARTGPDGSLIAAIFEMEPVDPAVLEALRRPDHVPRP
jgi:hypothetical protein